MRTRRTIARRRLTPRADRTDRAEHVAFGVLKEHQRADADDDAFSSTVLPPLASTAFAVVVNRRRRAIVHSYRRWSAGRGGSRRFCSAPITPRPAIVAGLGSGRTPGGPQALNVQPKAFS